MPKTASSTNGARILDINMEHETQFLSLTLHKTQLPSSQGPERQTRHSDTAKEKTRKASIHRHSKDSLNKHFQEFPVSSQFTHAPLGSFTPIPNHVALLTPSVTNKTKNLKGGWELSGRNEVQWMLEKEQRESMHDQNILYAHQKLSKNKLIKQRNISQ